MSDCAASKIARLGLGAASSCVVSGFRKEKATIGRSSSLSA
jgi:hypothetical protein